ncbi:hypothetical protein ACJJTC_003229 [Scirpophaga incertulas]
MIHYYIITIVLCLCGVNNVQPKEVYNDWDILIFTQQWPATVCNEWVHHDPSHTCVMPKQVDTWSIHGIWPTKLGTRGPLFCNRTWLFNPEEIRPIEKSLINVWTNIEGGTEPYSLWAHEWSKHGTCAAVLESFNSEFKYFSKGLDFLKQYNMTHILSQSGIVPNDQKKYALIDVYNAVTNQLHVNPSIQCREGMTYLDEVRICVDKNLQLVNCDGISNHKIVDGVSIITNCHDYIYYPHFKIPPKRIYIQLYKLVSWLQWFSL